MYVFFLYKTNYLKNIYISLSKKNMKQYQTSFIEDYEIGSLEKKEVKKIKQKEQRDRRKEKQKEIKLLKEKEAIKEADKKHVGDLFD